MIKRRNCGSGDVERMKRLTEFIFIPWVISERKEERKEKSKRHKK